MKTSKLMMSVAVTILGFSGAGAARAAEPLTPFCQAQIAVEKMNWREARNAARTEGKFTALFNVAALTAFNMSDEQRAELRNYASGQAPTQAFLDALEPNFRAAVDTVSSQETAPVIIKAEYFRTDRYGRITHIQFSARDPRNPKIELDSLSVSVEAFASGQDHVQHALFTWLNHRTAWQLRLPGGVAPASEDEYLRKYSAAAICFKKNDAPAQAEGESNSHEEAYEVPPPPKPGTADAGL